MSFLELFREIFKEARNFKIKRKKIRKKKYLKFEHNERLFIFKLN